jgi:CDP-glucose 4,6-dehydratase
MGTTHVLEAIRATAHRCTAVAVTSDKCYENKESGQGYCEDDPLGGHDPYSASKASAELVIDAYRRSYFSAADSRVKLASARAGNVIGGGDWALDRILPDCVRALQNGSPIIVRNPSATRPWQHVLEPVSGYLWLAARLGNSASGAADVASAFNFGPPPSPNPTVGEVVEEVLKHWPGRWENGGGGEAMHETKLLSLSTAKARRVLGWQPVWDFPATIRETVRWYRGVSESGALAGELTRAQIAAYTTAARAKDLPWSR